MLVHHCGYKNDCFSETQQYRAARLFSEVGELSDQFFAPEFHLIRFTMHNANVLRDLQASDSEKKQELLLQTYVPGDLTCNTVKCSKPEACTKEQFDYFMRV